MDETYALPTEQAVAIALRTQQILAAESGIANTVDPLAGSYYVETLTREMEQGCWEYFEKIDAMGGMVRAIEYCFPQREIQDAAYQYQRAVERKEKLIVGVNEFRVEEETGIDTLAIDSEVATKQKVRLQEVRASRNGAGVHQALADLRRAAEGTDNLMPHFINCARYYATLGEMCDVLRSVFGTYTEPIF
jgi:methylmalonyl-CoA mutase N-terminal domain/subunit